ncbi:MAG: LTA synthase family protein [Acetatifactor sp.]|nr:LTA synthase family protein [Acetatifactor sp.]
MSDEKLFWMQRAVRRVYEAFFEGVRRWLKDCLQHHKIRIFVGAVLFVMELYAFLGTGVLLEEQVNFHSGEGAWKEWASAENPEFCQKFVPQHRRLQLVSFLMNKSEEMAEGTVEVRIDDGQGEVVYANTLAFSELSDGSFTDVDVDLEVSTHKPYYLTLTIESFSAEGYPAVGVCDESYKLPENQTLTHGEVLPNVQLVTRYGYQDVLDSKVVKVLFLCFLTAFGVMFGLPQNQYVRRGVGILALVAAPYVLGGRLELLNYREEVYLPIALWWNVGLMYAMEIVVLLLTHSPRITVPFTNIALTLLYSANYYVLQFQGTPLRVNDFMAIGTAARVVGEYNFMPNGHLAMAWGLLLLFVVYAVQTGPVRAKANVVKSAESEIKSKTKKIVISYAVTAVFAISITVYGGYQLLYTDLLTRAGFEDENFRGILRDVLYNFNGYLVTTCLDIKNSHITPPDGYSVEGVENLLSASEEGQELSDAEKEALPHVILVMNESYSDLRILGNLELNQENMEFFYSLKENTVRGFVNASVFASGTANSEFEVLTGCSMAFLPVKYYPYQQCIRKPLNSLVSQMKNYGYTAYSMHPASSSSWNRVRVYRYYGFDESFWKEDFEGAERIHIGVSDEETYKKVIELYEGREAGEKLFVFDITIQNHGGYREDESPYAVTAVNMDNEEVDEYLSLIKISDEALAKLIGYFEEQEEKVVICMFGDHQPYVSDSILGESAKGNVEQKMNKYRMPFVIWANYDIEEADGYDISMNYLGGLLLRTAGVPLTPYFAYLEQLRADYPVITFNGYRDYEGNYSNWSGGEFPEYRMLQYNYLFDDNSVEWGY